MRREGRGIKHHPQAKVGRLGDDLRRLAGFILQQHQIAWLRLAQHGLHIGFRQAVVCAAVNDDSVLPLGRYLDHRMPGGLLHLQQRRGIRAGILQKLRQEGPIRANRPRVQHLRTRAGGGDGLVQPLAPGIYMPRRGRSRFAALHKMRHIVYVVNIQRAKIQ